MATTEAAAEIGREVLVEVALSDRADLLANQAAGFRRVLEAMKKPDRKPPADSTAVLVLDELVNALEQEAKWLRRVALALARTAGST